jgi:hypothetical protein
VSKNFQVSLPLQKSVFFVRARLESWRISPNFTGLEQHKSKHGASMNKAI